MKACGRKRQEARRWSRGEGCGRGSQAPGKRSERSYRAWSLVHWKDFGFWESEMGSTAEQGSRMMELDICDSLRRAGSVCNPMPSAGHGT